METVASKRDQGGRQARSSRLVVNVAVGRARYRDIVDNLVEAVEKGTLKPGDRLPPQRTLADQLKIAVGTVTRAYAEAERRGIVVAEVGRGTFVSGMTSTGPAPGARNAAELADFTHNRLPIDDYVGEFCKTLGYLAKRPNVAALLDYPPNAADVRFRTVGAAWIRRTGLPVTPEQVVVCNGVQHGLSVILGALSNPGDLVLTEELNYPGIRLLEKTYHLRLKGVAIDMHGLVPEALDEACRKEKARFLFCQPTVQNPTAAVMPPERRRQIAELVKKHDLILIEDDIYAFMPVKASTPITARVPDRGFYVTGTSKTIGTAIRVGYIVAPPAAVHELAATVHATTWMPAPFMAEIASMWMMDGTANRIIDTHRHEARKRQEIAARVLSGFAYRSHESAFHLWLALPKPWRHEDFIRECLNRNVAVNSSQNFVIGRAAPPEAVRICLGGFRTAGSLERGLEALRDVIVNGNRHRAFMV